MFTKTLSKNAAGALALLGDSRILEGGEKFREVVDKLLVATHALEQSEPGATQVLDKIRDRLRS